MSTRPNEAQELYDAYASSDENYGDDSVYSYGYDGDDDAYEGCPEDDDYTNIDDISDEDRFLIAKGTVTFFDKNGIPLSKANRNRRRRGTAMANRRFLITVTIVAKNLRARLSDADCYPNEPIPKYQVAKRLMATAKKMGMDI